MPRGKKRSLEAVAQARPEMFGRNGQEDIVDAEVIEDVEVVQPEETQALDLPSGFLRACSDGMNMGVEQAKLDIRECSQRMLEDYFKIGKRLFVLKAQLLHGEFERYVAEETPFAVRTARECMLIARRVIESKSADVRRFLETTASGSKHKAMLLLGMSDDEIDAAQESGELFGRPLAEVGEMSYRQLQEEVRKEKRNAERARKQRDAAESKIADLEEEVSTLREGEDRARRKPLTPIETEFGKLVVQFARFLGVLTDEDVDEDEIVRDGKGYLTRLNQEINTVAKILLPYDPGTEPDLEGAT